MNGISTNAEPRFARFFACVGSTVLRLCGQVRHRYRPRSSQ
jgi:hypothetical protein